MADEKPTIQVDTDWKRQAQEEKRRLAEQERQKAAAAPVRPGAAAEPAGGMPGAEAPAGGREQPAASFATLVQSFLTQVLFYLGDLAPRGGQPMLDLDSAKHNIDLLGILEEKTRGNLSAEEKRLLETALHETRMRFVNVASQMIR